MKKIFAFLFFSACVSSVFALQKTTEIIGIWKEVIKNSGIKTQPRPEYFLLTDDSIYVQGVDSTGNSLTGASSGRWTVRADSILILFPSDRVAETRFFKDAGENRFTFEFSKNQRSKKSLPAPEIEIYLEKCIRKEGQ